MGYDFLHGHRGVLVPALDGSIWVAALVGSAVLRYRLYDAHIWNRRVGILLLVAAATQWLCGYANALYRTRWRVGSFDEAAKLVSSIAITTAVVIAADVVALARAVPLSACIAARAFTVILTGAARGAWRLRWEHHQRPRAQAKRVIVFGAGEGGAQVIDALVASPTSPYVPVALLDDDPQRRHARIRNVRVSGGRHDMAAAARRHVADTVIIAIPSASSELIREVSVLAAGANLDVRVLPPVANLFGPGVQVADIRPVSDLDLLGRHSIDTEIDAVAGYIRGRVVLVTGAGGSIGSELCRQIHRFSPKALVMLDRDESGLHHVQLSIQGRAMLDDRCLVVCDIRDRLALKAAFTEHRPEVVFHTAALKHLPLLEMWPAEAVKTNVLGTQNVLDAALAVGVQRFVNISTDKAANPSSVLGDSKRIAERLTAGAGQVGDGDYTSVRFGNVLGSRGSVLTAFRAQLQAGGPLTVTHPDVTRYFMTVEEAVQLVVQAGAIGRTGEVLVLEMGAPVRIADVAERLAGNSGRRIEIVYTGLRPGEKLHEELYADGEVGQRTVHPMISRVRVPGLDTEASLEVTVALSGPGDIKRRLASLARQFARERDTEGLQMLDGRVIST